jgi:hypothetical protein
MNELKRDLKDLLIVSIQLAMFLITLSYIKELYQKIYILEKRIVAQRDKTNYYEKLKTFESVQLQGKELYESTND